MRRMKRRLQARCLALEEENIENPPRLFMRSYESNETVEPQSQPPIEEQSTQGDLSSTNIPTIDNQPMPPFPFSKERSHNSCSYAIKAISLWSQ